MKRALKILATILVLLALVPVLLIPLYRLVPPVSTLMIFDRLMGRPEERRWVDLDAVAPALLRSVVASEDARFCVHSGVDWGAIKSVLEDDQPSRGASTIAMQTVKNLFLWPSRSYLRKAIEIPLALYADAVLGKRRILEIYLNIAEWGPGIFGIEAAANRHFRRSASSLSVSEAGLLAASLPNPIERTPSRPSRGLQGLARVVEGRAGAADIRCVLD